ncbi:ATP-dependent transporter, putative [Ricinus communis]|uniref:ATP-dependent transporter, putative n=1 Tax=Ricinus communis TaxID=3988 RepID=B9SQW8_RICCO|nr:ATP-dependent transporter, putative [Ricinus communis]
MGTRVAIVGSNGAGKSTLFNLLAGDLITTAGEVRTNQKLRTGRYSQHFVNQLTMQESPVDYLLRLHPDQQGPSKEEAVRAKLGKFGLDKSNHRTAIAQLSGGQKARSIDALADELDEFTGGIVLVSHDSRLIARVCDNEEKSEIWIVENGTLRKLYGSFED